MKDSSQINRTDFFKNSLIVGFNDHLLCGEGWHERAVDGRFNFPYRPASSNARFKLILPGGAIDLHALISAGVTQSGGIMSGKITAENGQSRKFQIDTENWIIRKFTFTNLSKGACHFKLITDNPFIPDSLLKNGDFREMGIYLARIRIEPAESGGKAS